MQGYSKFVPAAFVKDGETGLAHALLGPTMVNTVLGRRNRIRIRCETNYPFTNYLDYHIKARHSFTFSFRVPEWAILEESGVWVNQRKQRGIKPNNVTGMHSISIPAGKTRVEVSFGAKVRVEPRANNTVAIYHGALLYALPIAGEYSTSRPARYPGDDAPPQAQDWTILPIAPWNLAIDTSTLRFYEYPNRYAEWLPNPIWRDEAPPVSISALACEIQWETKDGYALEPPMVGGRNCTNRAFPVELKPYGSAKLHMAELPTVDLRPGSPDLWDPGRSKDEKLVVQSAPWS